MISSKFFSSLQLTITLAVLAGFGFGQAGSIPQSPFTECPPIGADSSCAVLIVISDNGINTYSDPAVGPFDMVEDTLIGVLNKSSKTLFSLPLTSSNPIFSFDGDGICATDGNGNPLYTPSPPGCPFGPTGYEGPNTSFSAISNDMTSGNISFPNGLAPGKSTYFSLELAIQTECNPLQNVPLLKQFANPWGTQIYNGYTSTTDNIQRWGCYLTDCAMLINYFGGNTDPGALNTWLKANNGYVGGAVNPKKCEIYARTVSKINMSYVNSLNGRNDFTLDTYLCSGNPVMLQVGYKKNGTTHTHYVLATGELSGGAVPSYFINDPGFANSDLSAYGTTYTGLRLFTSAATNPSALSIVAHSPVELVLTSPTGQKTGLDPRTSTTYQAIPASSYVQDNISDDISTATNNSTPLIKTLYVNNPVDGTYTLDVIGTGAGPYSLDILGYDVNDNETRATTSGTASTDAVTSYKVSYSSAAGSKISVKPVTPVTPADLDLVITGSPAVVHQGGVVTYTMTFQNTGSAAANQGFIVDYLPPGFTFLDNSVLPCGGGVGVVLCNLGSTIPGHFKMSFQMRASVPTNLLNTGETSRNVTNSASITSYSVDPDSGDGPALATTTVVP